MDSLWQDLRLAARNLRRTPGFTFFAVLMLAIGIGATTTVFSMVNAVLLQTFPFEDPDQLVVAWKQDLSRDTPFIEISFSEYLDWRMQSRSFRELSAFTSNQRNIWENTTQKLSVECAVVSTSFFETLGIRPILGRDFRPEDDETGAQRVVLLGYELWQRHFERDPDAIGESITLSGEPFAIIGVLPAGYGFPSGAQLWMPAGPAIADALRKLSIPAAQERTLGAFSVVGRLRKDVDMESARVELNTVVSRIEQAHPELSSGAEVGIRPFFEHHLGMNTRLALIALLVSVGMVLLIACANVTSLIVARSIARQREVAVRRALGGARFQIIRLFLTESLILAVAGGVGGVVLANWGLRVTISLSPLTVPRFDQAGIDEGVLGFALGLSLFAALVVGLVPALQLSNPALSKSLGASAPGEPRGRQGQLLRNSLVVGEVALAVCLLIGASLTVESFLRLSRLDLGYSPKNVLTFTLVLPEGRYEGKEDQLAVTERLLTRISGVAGVESVGALTNRPFGPSWWSIPFLLGEQPLTWHEVRRDKEGQTRVYKVPDTRHFRENPYANAVAVTPDYFQTMGIRVLDGRGFTDQDDLNSPRVVAVSETFARRIWPGQSAIGKSILGPAFGYEWDENLNPVFPTVVGVVEEARSRELTIPHLDIYQPYRQSTMMPAHHFVVRTVSDPLANSPAIRAAVKEIDPELFLSGVTTMDEVVHSELAPWRFTTFLFSVFGFCAVLLASLGIFGVLAYSVARRKHEIGIRMALGAQAFQVLKLVIGRGMGLTLAGLAVGIGLAFGLTRFLSKLLYGVRPTDPVTFLGMSVLFVVVAALACYFPGRRAARTDPAVALRYE